jgi:hypothetical protein
MTLTHEKLMEDSLYRYIYKEVEQAQRWLDYSTRSGIYVENRISADKRYKYWHLRLIQYKELMNKNHDNRPIEDKFNETMQMDGGV